MVHKHSVRDTNAHFTIDQFTRQIKNSSAEKTTIVQYDHNSQRLTFEMPLNIDGHAMTLCDLIEIHFINISTDGKNKNHGTYEVNDIKADGDKAVFTWLISQEATQLAGSLSFFIVFKCTENGVTVYRWGTEICKTLAISEGMDNGETVLTEYPDILAQWKAQLFDASDTAVVNVATAEASALAAIEAAGEAKKQAVLDAIPDEYEALSALADQNHRNKAGAIVVEEEGESIVVNDASDCYLQGLKLFGKSTQDGTPTPDAPVDIVSVENTVVTVAGRNLCPESALDTMGINGTSNTYDITTRTITMDADPTGFAGRYCAPFKKMTVGENYTLSFSIRGTSGKIVKCGWDKKGVAITLTNDFVRYSVTLTATRENEPIVFYSRPIENGGLSNGEYMQFADVQIEVGEVATEYEPYIEAQTVETAHTIPGIPVSSGGNYTDENGQQWICDEVDLARGVYIQRTNRYTVNGSDIETWKISSLQSVEGATRFDMYIIGLRAGQQVCLCSHYPGTEKANKYPETCWCNSTGNASYFEFRICTAKATTVEEIRALVQANPVDVVYALYTPTETALSDAEINAFKALHSNKPNTTILNDAGAYMAIEYVADTKTYIDNKIAEMLSEN